MKRMLMGARVLVLVLGLGMTTMACGPGLTHHVQAPAPPIDVLAALDLELANSLGGTTTVTNADVRPDSRLATQSDRPAAEPATATTTWGASSARPTMDDDSPYD